MKIIDKIYINGTFVTPAGKQLFDLISPVTNEKLGEVQLGNEVDTKHAIAAAKKAFATFSKSSVAERIGYLKSIQTAVEKRKEDLIDVYVQEYGATMTMATISIDIMKGSLEEAAKVLETYQFSKIMGNSEVQMTPVGVAGIIIPWNASNIFVCGKIASAIAAGCTVVIKPSEMSANQTQVMAECIHDANLPKGVVNFVNGLGDVVGAEITSNPDIAKISFTGSTIVGKLIARGATETLKRVTLELGGKSPNILLDDADFSTAIPMAMMFGYMNSGQACIAGTRLLVPENRLEEAKATILKTLENIKVGNPGDIATSVGPMVSQKQFESVQNYIKIGLEEGATILAGGLGKPEGLEGGNFVKPTVFINVTNQMRIAQEEIFGPVLSVITYKTEEEAIEIANDTPYGLMAYVSSADEKRAHKVASQINAGTVSINGAMGGGLAPFGGFKQSGVGRENGILGMEAYLEPRTLSK